MSTLDSAGLECLTALADGCSFERAAQMLSITQSAVSQRLRSLEIHVGHPLVVRSRPLRLTEPGKVLLRFARQMQALRAEASRELGATLARYELLPIAVNADSLATWVLPALNELVRTGRQEGYGVELVVDDQDFTHDRLREGEVLGCVSSTSKALQGCLCHPLGRMRYVAVASPGFVETAMPQGLTFSNFSKLPFLAFNRKDDMQSQWVSKAFGVREPRLKEHFVPSSEAGANAAVMGWGVAVLPELLARPAMVKGQLIAVRPETFIDVDLYWHQWKLSGGEHRPATGHLGLIEQIGRAIITGARSALLSTESLSEQDPPRPSKTNG